MIRFNPFILHVIACLLLCFLFYGQEHFIINGYVKDKNTGEVLIGASLYETELQKGTQTNGYGYYSISLPMGKHKINCSYAGYQNLVFEIDLVQNLRKDFFLDDSPIQLGNVTVSVDSSTNPLTTNELNSEKITINSIRQYPVMFGEADAIKALQFQSGVKTLGDGSSALFVRGGNSDQNLILMDEAPIYNPSHLFGLVSVFNPDALNHIDFYKGNMPAQFGGRVSSVINAKMKEGNMYDYNFSASLSPFTSTLTANGPIVTEKSSFFFSGRRSFIDLFLRPNSNSVLTPSFYDINMKVNTIFGKNRLFISFYNGKDLLESADGFFNNWGNTSGTIRWNHTLGNRGFINTSLILSDYQNFMEFKDNQRSHKWLTGLNDINLKIDLSYFLRPNHTIKIGLGSIYHKFIPGESSYSANSIPRIQSFEHALYALSDISLLKWLGLNYGLRLTAFQNHGKATWFDYDEKYLPIASHANTKGVYKTFVNLEPRLSVNLKLNSDYSLKLGYTRNVQYMQILQNNSLSYSSLEAWFPSNPNIKPVIADIVSTGWFQRFGKGYFLSLELYHKHFQNQIDYIDHARLLNNSHIEGQIRSGKAKAYGAELNLKKERGRLKGVISYTYSRALRKISGINKGLEYRSPYDIPHDFKLTSNYILNERWTFTNAWLFSSGRPVTLPVGFYDYKNDLIPIYTGRNSCRLPNYNRLDVSFVYQPKKQANRVNWVFNFGIFNLYAKKNPVGYEFEDRSKGEVKVYQNILFTIIPNFSIKAEL